MRRLAAGRDRPNIGNIAPVRVQSSFRIAWHDWPACSARVWSKMPYGSAPVLLWASFRGPPSVAVVFVGDHRLGTHCHYSQVAYPPRPYHSAARSMVRSLRSTTMPSGNAGVLPLAFMYMSAYADHAYEATDYAMMPPSRFSARGSANHHLLLYLAPTSSGLSAGRHGQHGQCDRGPPHAGVRPCQTE